MSEEEIKDYLKRVDELDAKLTGEDKETLQWLLFGYNECARLLNEKEQKNKQLKEQVQDLKADYGTIAQIERDLYKDVIEEVSDRITIKLGRYINEKDYVIDDVALDELLQILDKAKD